MVRGSRQNAFRSHAAALDPTKSELRPSRSHEGRVNCPVALICPTTQDRLQPSQQNFSLNASPKSNLQLPPSCPTKRGVGHRHERWDGLRWTRWRRARDGNRRAGLPVSGSRRAGRTALMRTAKPCGPGTRGWCQAAGGEFDPTGSIEPSSRQRWRQDEFVSRESAA